MKAELRGIKRIPYVPGMFDEFKAQKRIDDYLKVWDNTVDFDRIYSDGTKASERSE